mmetsp:Transcript_3858/g.9190  ORF Transcript_3858/g.9190 Transcript_3858/m.9190 type:complete len:257 (-) Transcript_3858:45-815(-)
MGGNAAASMTPKTNIPRRPSVIAQITGHSCVEAAQARGPFFPNRPLLLARSRHSLRCIPRKRWPFSVASSAGVEPVTSRWSRSSTAPPWSSSVAASPLPTMAAQCRGVHPGSGTGAGARVRAGQGPSADKSRQPGAPEPPHAAAVTMLGRARGPFLQHDNCPQRSGPPRGRGPAAWDRPAPPPRLPRSAPHHSDPPHVFREESKAVHCGLHRGAERRGREEAAGEGWRGRGRRGGPSLSFRSMLTSMNMRSRMMSP